MTASLRDAFVEKVTAVMDRDVFLRNNTNKQGSWRFPLTDDKKLDDVSLSTNEARTVAKGLQHLVDVCVEAYPQDYKDSWSNTCAKFNVTMVHLDSKKHFKYEDMCELQLAADEFCDVYISLTGRDGMTNYFHNLHTGHYSYFLLKYGNLHRMSQQGWENVNGRFTREAIIITPRRGVALMVAASFCQ